MPIENSVLLEWPKQGVLDKLLRSAAHFWSSATGKKSDQATVLNLEDFESTSAPIKGNAIVRLDDNSCYVDLLSSRGASETDLRQIFINQQFSLSPITQEKSVIIPAMYTGNTSAHPYLVVESKTLKKIEKQARHLGVRILELEAQSNGNERFLAPLSFKESKTELKLKLIAWLSILGATYFLLSAAASYQDKRLKFWSSQELALQRELVLRTEKTQETSILREVSRLSPENMTATGRLKFLANLTHATPKHAYWTNIRMSPAEIEIEGLSRDTASLLSSMTASFPNYQIEFSEAISKNSEEQSFSMVLKEKNLSNE